jgi:hypothetical protein
VILRTRIDFARTASSLPLASVAAAHGQHEVLLRFVGVTYQAGGEICEPCLHRTIAMRGRRPVVLCLRRGKKGFIQRWLCFAIVTD